MADRYLIVGNGVAVVNAAEAIRARDSRAQVTILTDQECEFYSRPSLYYVLLGRIEFEDTAGRPRGFYRDGRFDLRCATSVSAIHPRTHTVTLANEEQLGYDRLLLALGT